MMLLAGPVHAGQQEPREGEAATERTDVWVFFDDDHVAFIIDPFYDRRNGLEFLVNPIGGRMDGQITSERFYNGDWNPIWDVEVGRFDGGWTVETAIPFKSIRHQPGRDQLWEFNVRRVNLWKNEHSFLTPIPSSLGDSGIFQMSRAAPREST